MDDTIHIDTDLTFRTVSDQLKAIDSRWNTAGPPTTIDLSGAGRIDSAGLAFLLELLSRARRNGTPLNISHAPPDLTRLAALCEASELLQDNPAQAGQQEPDQ
jgi:phospholipid transport system transporter-binding protein